MFIYPSIYRKLKRGPQVILPKDIGMIIAYSCISKESVCVDAGTGSGWLAITLARLCRHVYSYEIRADFISIAEKNMKALGIENLSIINKDVSLGIEQSDADLVVLDIPNAEAALPSAFAALKKGGTVVGYLPHAEQVKAFVEGINASGFHDAYTIETIVRDFLVRKEGVRPTNMGIWHTAYLVFARK